MKSPLLSTLFSSVSYAAVVFGTLFFNTSAQAKDLKVVEMFTSQGCYSCPPADELIAKMAARDSSILNLEFHVDYWNQLRYRGEGNWVDPYSSPEYSKRQRQYGSLGLSGRNGVYTPQAVINGVYGNVGSNRRAMSKGLALQSYMPVSVNIDRKDDNTLSISVEGSSSAEADVYFVSFLKSAVLVQPAKQGAILGAARCP